MDDDDDDDDDDDECSFIIARTVKKKKWGGGGGGKNGKNGKNFVFSFFLFFCSSNIPWGLKGLTPNAQKTKRKSLDAFLKTSLVCCVGIPLVYVLKDDNIVVVEVERGRRRQRRGGGGKEEQEDCKDARCQRTEVHRRWGKQREHHLVLRV